MANPSAVGDPNCYSSAIPNTEVHAAAGPLNHWFYLLANGTSGSTSCNGSTLTGIGIQNAGKVFYNGLLLKTSSWTHAKARVATLTAAKNLFGTTDCTTFNRVRDAWAGGQRPGAVGRADLRRHDHAAPDRRHLHRAHRDRHAEQPHGDVQAVDLGLHRPPAASINACLTGPSGTDFDLYVQKLSGSRGPTSRPARAPRRPRRSPTPRRAGTYRIEIYAYSGSGSYTLKYDTP